MAGSDDGGRLSRERAEPGRSTTVEELTGYKPEAVTGLEWDGESGR